MKPTSTNLDVKGPGGAAAPDRPGRRERRRMETREKILRAALGLFATRGFQDTTIEAITEAADVGKGTFFNYFPSKEHVLATYGERQRAKIEEAAAVVREGRRPVRGVLLDMIRALYEEPGKSPEMCRSIFSAVLSSEAVRGMMERNLESGLSNLAEILAIGQRRGEIRNDRAAKELAGALQRSFSGAMIVWSIRPEAPLAEQLDASFELFWSGIGAASVGGPKEKRK